MPAASPKNHHLVRPTINYEFRTAPFRNGPFKQIEKRDPAEILSAQLPDPIRYETHRTFVKEVLEKETCEPRARSSLSKKSRIPPRLAEDFDPTEMAKKFRQALAEEENDLTLLRGWLKREIKEEAHMGAS